MIHCHIFGILSIVKSDNILNKFKWKYDEGGVWQEVERTGNCVCIRDDS